MIRRTRDSNQNYMIKCQTSQIGCGNAACLQEEDVMSDFPPIILKDGSMRQREPTKLECGLFGALCATSVLGVLFWLGVQFSLHRLIIQLS